jgi:DNA repair protein RecO (recombination protein O)
MSIKKSEAFILNTFNIGEQDKIITFFSKERGILKGVAKGARKFGNRFGSCLEPLSHIRLVYYEKERRELVTINHCDLIDSVFDLQKNIKTSFSLSYFSELIQEFFPLRTKEDILFRLLLATITALKKEENLELLSAYFEAWVLHLSGVLPHFERCQKCRTSITEKSWLSPKKDGVYCEQCVTSRQNQIGPEIIAFLKWTKKNPPPQEKCDIFSPQVLKSIRRTLQSLIVFHLEKEPKSLRYMKNQTRE